MNIEPIAYYRSMQPTKFGVPRQSGLVPELRGRVVFEPRYRNADALRGLDAFDYIWLIWGFSANGKGDGWRPTVRPPLLGGNKAMGVFATRSPFRPNAIGLSSVKIDRIEYSTVDGPLIYVRGADLMDGTPIYDIKPYVAYADAHPEARSGFVDEKKWETLTVDFPDDLRRIIPVELFPALVKVLELDPRPQYHDDNSKVYGMPFDIFDIRFVVDGKRLTVVDIVKR